MKQLIQQRAFELGFDAWRFTSAEPPETADCFRRWLAVGKHGGMAYLHRSSDKRTNPQLVLDGAKTIILLACSYAGSDSATGVECNAKTSACDLRLTGFMARYARFGDYHDILGSRLAQLTHWLNQLGGKTTQSLWYVDTGPILERDLAQRSGLGFAGKHTNLISRQLGNWIFLSEILTTLELAPDPPEKNRCGTCVRCMDACPTRAITAPFELDARRCISYLTIELKGPIPLEFRTAIGNRIFGCDDCLAACPWNRFAQEGRLMRESARPDLPDVDLLALLSLDDAGFKARFSGTPLQRLKRSRLVRNVCVALGNVGDAGSLPCLASAASGPDELISEHASWAIEQIHKRT